MPRSWRLAPGWEPIPGIGAEPMSEEEFEERVRRQAERHVGADGTTEQIAEAVEAFRMSGVYVFEDDAPPRRRTREGGD